MNEESMNDRSDEAEVAALLRAAGPRPMVSAAAMAEARAAVEAEWRSVVAARRKLQRVEDTVLVPRDDGGPADRLWIYKGGAEITKEFDEPGIVAVTFRNSRGDLVRVD